jgi:hypothetical protein
MLLEVLKDWGARDGNIIFKLKLYADMGEIPMKFGTFRTDKVGAL